MDEAHSSALAAVHGLNGSVQQGKVYEMSDLSPHHCGEQNLLSEPIDGHGDQCGVRGFGPLSPPNSHNP